MQELKNIIESLLFVSEEPLSVETFKRIVDTAETKDIRAALQLLMEDYGGRESSFYLSEVAGGFQLRTRPEYAEWIKRLIQPKPQRLSRAALETLAIIAYKQPVIRSDVEHIRGVDSGAILRMLLERKLVRVLGRKEIPGRPLIYATTKIFLEIFGLKDLKDLPSPKEIAELNDLPQEMDEASFFAQNGPQPQVEEGSAPGTEKEPGTTPDNESEPDIANDQVGGIPGFQAVSEPEVEANEDTTDTSADESIKEAIDEPENESTDGVPQFRAIAEQEVGSSDDAAGTSTGKLVEEIIDETKSESADAVPQFRAMPEPVIESNEDETDAVTGESTEETVDETKNDTSENA
jgi:segregation and condensation protein B